MVELSVRASFSAAHHLRGHAGGCANLHGHNWEVEVLIRGETLDEMGMLVDFQVVKQAVREAMAALDHADLNAHPAFRQRNPTSENLAGYLYGELRRRLDHPRYRVWGVRVSESPGSSVLYWETPDAGG